MNKKELDDLADKLKKGEIGFISEKSEYIKELEEAYLKTRQSNSKPFKEAEDAKE